jgi:LytR cell envelope-related transcriptional attenuator
VNLSTGRVLIIVALVVAGLAVLANGFADSGTTAAVVTTTTPTIGPSPTDTETQSPSTSTASPTQTPKPNKTGVAFMALNGTDVPGAGAAAQTMLTADGYDSVATASDVPNKPVPKTTIYYRPDHSGQNQSDATYVSDQYFRGSSVKKLNTEIEGVVPEEAAIVVVVGVDWATKITA